MTAAQPPTPSPADSGDHAAVHAAVRAARAVEELRDAWRKRYGAVVGAVAVEAPAGGSGLIVSGTVLLPSQRNAVASAVAEAAGDVPVDVRVEALAPRNAHLGWVQPTGPVLDVLTRPDGDLATQLMSDDPPARRLADDDGWAVVQLADGTVGWARADDLATPPDARMPASVEAWREGFAGRPAPADARRWREALAPWLGAPYRWGGNAPNGIDCSGLTQRVYRAAMGLGLPKHSGDQVRLGRRVPRSGLAVGDLVHLTHVERGIGHVGVVVDDAPLAVAHASFDAGAVVVEPLADMLRRYRFRGARRFGAPPSGSPAHRTSPAHRSGPATDVQAPPAPGEPATDTGAARPGTATPAARCAAARSADERRRDGDDRAAAWRRLRALTDRDVHVVGLASTEGAAMTRFLWGLGVRRLTVHDFQPDEDVRAAFLRTHVGLSADARERLWGAIEALPITRRFGDRYLEDIEAADAVFAGQAWYLYPPNLPRLADLRARGVPFHGITELYFDLAPARILAVTGSNGKSTTSRLAEAILRQTGQGVHYAGNERRSVQVLGALDRMLPDDWLVLEVSNRQLVDIAPRPSIGVVTNVLPNHLDEHGGTMEAYAAVKRNLVARLGDGDRAVLNADNPYTRAMGDTLGERAFWFSVGGPVDRGAWAVDGRIRIRDGPSSPAVDLGVSHAARLPGAHNEANILAAAAAAWLAGADAGAIRRGIDGFRGLRHRLQWVWSADGVAYYDDLNATTPQATIAALDAIEPPIVLIAGGDDKGLDLTLLAERIAARVRRLVLLPGPGSDRIDAAVRVAGAGPIVDRRETLGDAVASAVATAERGDSVLLSPACPFFFSRHYLAHNADELGFRALLRRLTTGRSGAGDAGPDAAPPPSDSRA